MTRYAVVVFLEAETPLEAEAIVGRALWRDTRAHCRRPFVHQVWDAYAKRGD